MHSKTQQLVDWCLERTAGLDPAALAQCLDVLGRLAPEGWLPDRDSFVPDLLCLCAALGRLDGVTAEGIRRKVTRQLAKSGEVEDGLLAELHAAALLRPWGNEVEWISSSNEERRADFRLRFPGQTIEVEVTHAAVKAEQTERSEVAARVRDALSSDTRNRQFRVHFLDRLSAAEILTIKKASIPLAPGETAEVAGRWTLAVLRGDSSDLSRAQPTWWPDQLVDPVSLGETAVADGRLRRANRVEVIWGLSVESYLNPIRRKAERPQTNMTLPSIVALDATQLPGGIHWFARHLSESLQHWPRISGVMVFQRSAALGFSPPSLLWFYWFVSNEAARMPLPMEVAGRVGHRRDTEPFWSSATACE